MWGVRQRWELDIRGGGDRLKREESVKEGDRKVGRNRSMRWRKKEGWRTTRNAERSEGEAKKESRRRGGRGEGEHVVKEDQGR